MIHQRFPRLVALGLTLALLVALLAFFARAASAQDFDVPQDSTIHLTLSDAMRLATQLNPKVGSARGRVAVAQSRVKQNRADLLPTLSASVVERGSTYNSAALFPLDFPSAPGQPPLLDKNGSLLGPLNVLGGARR